MIISEALYRQICRVMPIPCVDLLIADRQGRVLLVNRKNEPASGQWWFPGGRVYFGETRGEAAKRKLKDECGLEAATLIEIGTFDLILKAISTNTLHHAITTLFHIEVEGRDNLRLDEQSGAADWRYPLDWRSVVLSPFIIRGFQAIDRIMRK